MKLFLKMKLKNNPPNLKRNKFNRAREDYDINAAYNKNTDFEYPAKDDKYRKTHDNGFGGKYRNNKFPKQNFDQNNYNYTKNQDVQDAGYQRDKPNYPKKFNKRGGDFENYKQTDFDVYNDFKDANAYTKDNEYKKQDDFIKHNEFEIYNTHDFGGAGALEYNNFSKAHGEYKPPDQSKQAQIKNYKSYYDSTKPKNDTSAKPFMGAQQHWKQSKVEPEAGNENKPIFSDHRMKENKALFEKQMKSIQKTLLPTDTKDHLIKTPYTETTGMSRIHKCKYVLLELIIILNCIVNQTEKHESKVTAFAGSGIVNDLMKTNDEFMISTFEKEEKKPMNKYNSSLADGKRSNIGFKTSAASMFTSQTGGKNCYQD